MKKKEELYNLQISKSEARMIYFSMVKAGLSEVDDDINKDTLNLFHKLNKIVDL